MIFTSFNRFAFFQAHELELSTVKCMRGLLTSMMRQRNKVERFKDNYSPCDAIHAKFDVASGTPVRLCSFETII
jgi:hypothetical protein